MTEIFDVISDLLDQGEDLVLTRVISVKGSAPREVGASMVIRRNGEIAGTVGGGLIEAAAIKKAPELFRKKGFARLTFDMTSDDLTSEDMVCGGKLELLVEYLPADEETINVFTGVKDSRRNNQKSFLITSLPDLKEGTVPLQRCLLSPGNTCATGSDGSAEVMDRLKDTVHSLTGPSLVEIDEKRFWVDIIPNRGVLYIFGAGHISREVNDLASRVGFMTVVLDDRAEFANQARFKKPAEVIVLKSFENCFDGLPLDGDSYVVIVTRGHLYDKAVLEQALRSKAGYIGMIGSARKRDTIYKALLAEGFTLEQLESVRCPIGMKIDTETPAEIAVSIVGELIDVRSQKRQWNMLVSQQ